MCFGRLAHGGDSCTVSAWPITAFMGQVIFTSPKLVRRDIVPVGRQLSIAGLWAVPTLFLDAGEQSWRRFVEFFTANIRNKNTREAYGRAVAQFSRWCEARKITLERLTPVVIATYVEHLMGRMATPSVKQHLAAVRMVLGYMVTGGVLATNPAAAVRGPKYSLKRGKTPVLDAGAARRLLDSIVSVRRNAFLGKRPAECVLGGSGKLMRLV